MNNSIPFNKPCVVDRSQEYLIDVLHAEKLSGNGDYTKKCHLFFENKYGFNKVLLTTSCTDALEMASLLIDAQDGDEIIVPSYTFVSSALAFTRQGAKIVFADSETNTPNLDVSMLETLITPRTKAIIPVHYAGVAVDMDPLLEIAKKHNLFVVEDAAQAIDSYYKGKPLGSLGDFGCFSFHDTKNITSGEGGMLVINNPVFSKRAEILWEKGTNRSEFFRGEVNKYGWVDTGSSFLPSELNAALLFSQLERMEEIQRKRLHIWNIYNNSLKKLEEKKLISLQKIPEYATNNGHMYYMVCNTPEERTQLIEHLRQDGIHAVFHYLSLHKSEYAQKHNSDKSYLPMSDYYTERLVRLPLFYSMSDEDVDRVVSSIFDFFQL